MPRPRHRVPLESGLSLKLPRMKRQGLIVPGVQTRGTIQWGSGFTLTFEANLLPTNQMPRLDIYFADIAQRIDLQAQPRHFGGKQWYFECPVTRRLVTALWLHDGAGQFVSRHAWAGQIGYSSQFETWQYRALRGAFRIRERLDPTGVFYCVGDIVPPKPKRMRWATYERLLERLKKYERTCAAYDQVLSARLERLV